MAINPKPFIHPLDRRALKALESMPGLKAVLRKYIDIYEAKWSEGLFLSSFVRLNERQLPDIYSLFRDVFEALEMTEDEYPRCFLEMNPVPDAYAKGYYKRKFLVITSGLVQLLSRRELKAVIAHECGHAVCDHMIYKSLVRNTGTFGLDLFGLNVLIEPFRLALLYWDRCSALSCDRIAAYVMDDCDVVCDALIRTAGGPIEITGALNVSEYGRQVDELVGKLSDSKYQALLQMGIAMYQKYPFSAIRYKEVRQWFNDPATILPMKNARVEITL